MPIGLKPTETLGFQLVAAEGYQRYFGLFVARIPRLDTISWQLKSLANSAPF